IRKGTAASINVADFTGTYDGLPHSGSGTATGVHGEDLSSLLSFQTFTNYPGGTATWIFAGNNDYLSANGTVNVVITKAPLTVTANNVARLYSFPNPMLTASYAGFVNGEMLATSGVTGAPDLSTTATQFS